MNTLPLIVNHKTDPKKVNGLLVSTYSYLGQYQDEKGETQMTLVNINNVIWPELPTPLHHKETDEDLEFVSVYDPNTDEEERSEEEEANEAIVSKLADMHPEIYESIIDEINNEVDDEMEMDSEEETEETEEAEEAHAEVMTTTTGYEGDDAHAPNN